MRADPGAYDLLHLGHNIVEETFRRRGLPLARVPFPAAIYRRATGQNLSAQDPAHTSGPAPNWRFYLGKPLRWVRRVGERRRFTATLRSEFGLPSA